MPGAADPGPLSARRAFVVQLAARVDLARAHLSGRVEHVVSGAASRFESLDDLLGFIARVLGQAPPLRPRRPRRRPGARSA